MSLWAGCGGLCCSMPVSIHPHPVTCAGLWSLVFVLLASGCGGLDRDSDARPYRVTRAPLPSEVWSWEPLDTVPEADIVEDEGLRSFRIGVAMAAQAYRTNCGEPASSVACEGDVCAFRWVSDGNPLQKALRQPQLVAESIAIHLLGASPAFTPCVGLDGLAPEDVGGHWSPGGCEGRLYDLDAPTCLAWVRDGSGLSEHAENYAHVRLCNALAELPGEAYELPKKDRRTVE